MKDLVDPESISSFKLCSGKIMYGSSFTSLLFREMIGGSNSDLIFEGPIENLNFVH